MNISPTICVDQLFSDSELECLTKIISENSKITIDRGQNYNDAVGIGRDYGKLIAEWHDLDFDDLPELKKNILPKINQAIGCELIVQDLHMLTSYRPYMLHNDVTSVRGITRKEFKNCEPEYTIIIPLETCDSCTVVFNETHNASNNFEIFKKEYTDNLTLKLDKKLILERLTHLHPKDLLYLSLHVLQPWNKGAMFAIDRRYFHCSDNFLKRNVVSKKSIVIRTVRKIIYENS
jgi:hypothetical protein